jgi:hypothetical protein
MPSIEATCGSRHATRRLQLAIFDTMTQQLLIEMPAEGAARLLTLSLLEQLMHGAATSADPTKTGGPSTTFEANLARLRGCMSIYADALGDDIPRKARRHLRQLSDTVRRLRQADTQLGWITRYLYASVDRADDASMNGTDGRIAARWLNERVARRRRRVERAFERMRAGSRPLKRLAKRLGVYRTAVRIDEMPTQRSFAALTGTEIISEATRLSDAFSALRMANDPRATRRALTAAAHVLYLIEPIRAYVDVEALSKEVQALRAALQRLDDLAVVARVIIRGGRRIGSSFASEQLRSTLWPSRRVDAPVDVDTLAQLSAVQRGLVVMATSLGNEMAVGSETFASAWLTDRAGKLVHEIRRIGASLEVA